MLTSLAFTAGAATWSLAEYLIHRHIGHGPKRKRATGLTRLTPEGLAAEFNAEHLAHHADPQYFAPSSRKAVAGVVVIGTLGAGLSVAVGPSLGLAYAVGLGLTYASYEVIHRRIHTHPPTGPYSRWVRHHHLLHHHRSPRENHGVTTALWDHVFGTHATLPKVRIPRHMAPPWLLDPVSGAVRAELSGEYELAGRGPAEEGTGPTTLQPSFASASASG
jgi:hypothetical protein